MPATGSSSRLVRSVRLSEASLNLGGATLPTKLTYTVPEAAALLGISPARPHTNACAAAKSRASPSAGGS